MPSIIFDNVNLLGYQHENKFFGEKSISYASVKTFSIRGYILDLANTNGIDNVLNTATVLAKEGKNFQEIIINKENFGVGKIKSFNVDSGDWVRSTEYQATIEVLAEVPLQNISSTAFNNLNLTGKNLNLLKNLNENFSVNFDSQNKILDGEHSIEIEYDANNKDINLIKLAQTLAIELLKTIPTSLSEANYTTRSNYRVFNSENYDIVNGKSGFKRSFSYSAENTDKPYSIKRLRSIDISEDGLVTVKDNCEIKAEYNIPSLYANALIGLNEDIVNAYNRSVTLFNVYKEKFGITRNLNSHEINRNITINKFNGIITYDITFDNDPKKANPSYLWETTQTIDRSEDGIWSASEQGSINGVGKTGDSKKYENAETGWNGIKTNIETRVTNFYNNYAKNKSGDNLKQLNKTINRSKYDGTITYTYNYSDDPTIKTSGDVRKVNIDLSDTGLPPILKTFIIPNNKYTLVQNRNFKNQGTFTVSVKMEIGCISTEFNGKNYFNEAKSYAGFGKRSGIAPYDPQDYYLESINFTSNETDKSITYEEVYKYS